MSKINRTSCLVCGDAFRVGDCAQAAGVATKEGPSGGGWVHLVCQREYRDLQAEAAHQAGTDFMGHQNAELSTYREEQPEALNWEYAKDGRDQDGGCPWCGRDCPDAGKPEGCWYQGCPDFPHGE